MAVRLIVGLGNPGPKYTKTRHNAGAWLTVELAEQHRTIFREEPKFSCQVATITVKNQPCFLLIPSTFMNESGRPVQALAHFYKIAAEEILVAHDELDFPAGTARLKVGGGHGGHNGLRDIIQRLGNSFYRLRIGIDHPGDRDQVTPYVLGEPSAQDKLKIIQSITDSLAIIPDLVAGDIDGAFPLLTQQDLAMGFKCGIVGLPNVGKSTLFNALTKAGIEAANYPFCTIEPNVGIVPMPDERLNKIAALVQSKQIVPTTMKFVDIAGLVAGAAQGEGLGNQFLAHIRETQAIAHVVRCFANDDVVHVAGKVDPLADIEVIHTELALADLTSVDKALQKFSKDAKKGLDKAGKQAMEVLEKLKAQLNQGQAARLLNLEGEDLALVEPLQLITMKPVLYVANVDEGGMNNNPYLEQVLEYAQKTGSEAVPICAALESEIAELPEAEQKDFLSSLGLEEPGLNRLIRVGYRLLGLQTYFTAGPKEARAWTIARGDKAPRAAAAIHTDFEKGFIRAEVIGYQDFITYRGEQGAKEAGKWRLEGKDYIVQDGDVILFRFNV